MLRDHINQWAAAMPVDKELLGRLRYKKDSRKFYSAMFELVFFTCCKQAGLPIERIHSAPVKTTDYKIIKEDSAPIFLECRLVANAMEDFEEHRRRTEVNDMIENMTDFAYGIAVRYELIGKATISAKALRKSLQEFVGSESFKEGEIIPFTYEDWELGFRLWPKKNVSERTFTGESGFAKTIDNNKPILAALNDKKPSAYDIDQSPYVICLAIDDITADLEEFAIALIGGSHEHRVNLTYNSKAFFYYGTKPINTSASAVIFCKNIHPTSFTGTRISVWHNPFAKNPISHGLFPFEQFYYRQEDNYLYPHKITGSFNMMEVLGIDQERYLEYLQLKHRKAPN
jgi:hypothetical protein